MPVIARHGEGLQDKDYINIMMNGAYAQITEGKTAFEWLQAIDIADEYLLQDLSWGNAINTAIMYKTKKLLRIRKESIEDFPF